MDSPETGTMVYWRFKQAVPGTWNFGYVSETGNRELVRMGSYNGDQHGGQVVSVSEIEWKKYTS